MADNGRPLSCNLLISFSSWAYFLRSLIKSPTHCSGLQRFASGTGGDTSDSDANLRGDVYDDIAEVEQ